MKLSVVVPTFNRLTDLKRVLAAAAAQELPSGAELELVVVDDGSSDGSGRWLAGWRGPGRVAISQANAGPAKARNRGARAASGEVLAFLGDDTVPQPGWAAEHLETQRVLAASGAVAVLGHTSFPAADETPFLRYVNELGAQFGYSLIADPTAVPFNFFYTSNISLPRQLFLELGGFREDFPAAAWEDIEFAYRAAAQGLRIVYQPRARTVHHHRIRPGTFCNRQRTAGRSGAIFAALHPELAGFLGVPRAGETGGRHELLRRALLPLAVVADLLPGVAPDRLFKRFLDLCYLRGLAEGLHR